MAIRGSILQSQVYKLGGGGFLNSGRAYIPNRLRASIEMMTYTNAISQTQSCPGGYKVTDAILVPMIDGGMAGRSSFLAEVSSNIIGVGYIDGVATVTISVSAIGDLLASINGAATVAFTTACELMGIGYVSGLADISAQPTAADIAGETWAIRLEGNYTARDLMKLMSAVLVGKISGAATSTNTIRDVNDTVNRIVATVDGDGNRTVVTKNVT